MASLGQFLCSVFHLSNLGWSGDILDTAIIHDVGKPVSQCVSDEKAVIHTVSKREQTQVTVLNFLI